MTKSITLTQGKVALVDDADFDWLNQWKWRYSPNGTGYASRVGDGDSKMVLMHRQIANPPDGKEVDHINGVTLDNRRENLRVCSHSQNMHNRRLRQKNNKSGYKGVHWLARTKRWVAEIRVNGKSRHLGYFTEKTDAARAYDTAAAECFGEFAHLNFE